jgi:2,3-bisphosphoglycerate-dependent phosphoglycerate mutase
MDILLIRHAQSGNNLLWERNGSSRGRSADPELTPLGLDQAQAVARAFAAGDYPRPTHLFTSLMLRAVQTAAPLAETLDLPLIGHAETFEFFGPVEYDPDDHERRWHHPGASRQTLQRLSPRLTLPSPAGEDGWWRGPVEDEAACDARARRVVRDLIQTHGGSGATLALVTHGTFSQYLIRALLGIETMTGWLAIGNTSVSQFRDVETLAVASWINRVDHLGPGQRSD